MGKRLHIISFDIPYPPNYGGVIDVYYKLYWLKRIGIKTHLHCFEYGRKHAKELNELCESVNYYKRDTSFIKQLSSLPYTVSSRISSTLKENLLKDDYPILFEVLHTCFLINDPELQGRFKIYRHSNLEHDYYNGLADSEKNLLKKLYYRAEARKLKKFESVISKAQLILAVNQKDTEYFKEKYPQVRSEYLPSFHKLNDIKISPGKGDYILFHGNLGINENSDALHWLLENVFSKINHQVIIAGLNPSADLQKKLSSYKHIKVIANPSEQEMDDLIQKAHIHTLYTNQSTGLKLKLLNTLYSGRFIVCNELMLEGSGVLKNESIYIEKSPTGFLNTINLLFPQEFDLQLVNKRRECIQNFDNILNANKLSSFLP